MDLYLQRHGRAAGQNPSLYPDDGQRPLTEEGRVRTAKVAQGMKRLALGIDLVLSSPLVRARQTADIVAAELGLARRLVLCDALAPGQPPGALIKALRTHAAQAGKVLLVGHEPDLGRLVGLLTTGNMNLQLRFKRAAVCKLRADSLRAGRCATLEWMLAPGHLVKLRK